MAENVGGIFYDVTFETRQLIEGRRRIESETDKAARSFNVITKAVQVYAAALALLKMAEVADDFKLLQARVNVASKSIGEGADNMERLRKISTETRSALAGNVQVFARLNPSIKEMGGNANDTLRVVSLLAKAITVSGVSAAEKTSLITQFGQAITSATGLAGDELKSLSENAPYLMQRVAEGLGVPIGSLKALGAQGKLTADVVLTALGKATDKINKDFAQFPQTVSSALTVAGDALSRLISKLDEFSGKNAILTGVIGGVTKVLSTFADMLERAGQAADGTARKTEIQGWATTTAKTLSYVADVADVVWQTLSVLGRNVSFVIDGVGREIGGILAQAKMMQDAANKSRSITDPLGSKGAYRAMQSEEFKGISEDLKAEGERRRKVLDDADARTLTDRKLWGQQMREEWAKSAAPAAADGAASKLKAAVDPEVARKQAAQRAAAKAYYEGLLADTQTGLAKIAAEQKKAEAENDRRQAEAKGDKGTMKTLLDARLLIVEKFERERAALEEGYAKDRAAADIAVTTDEQTRILAIRNEAFRAADAEVRLGVKTVEQGENAKRVAAFQTGQMMLDLADRNARARADQQLAETRDAMERIRLTEAETISALMLAKARDKITQAEYEAGVAKAKRQTTDDTRAVDRGRDDVAIDTLQLKSGAGGVEDQVALIRAEAAKRIKATREAQDADLLNALSYADQRIAIEEDMQRRITATRAQSEQNALTSTANAFDALVQATQSGTGKQDAIYKAAFIAQKAFAIASSIVAIQTGVAQASSLPWPANLGAMASVIAATASIISTIKGTNYGGGRQYGGPVSAGSMYRVNETGRPEMYTAANGAQYMLPTASGNVTPADQVGGQGGGKTVVMNITQNFTVQQGTSTQTQAQMATAAARGLQQALARNG